MRLPMHAAFRSAAMRCGGRRSKPLPVVVAFNKLSGLGPHCVKGCFTRTNDRKMLALHTYILPSFYALACLLSLAFFYPLNKVKECNLPAAVIIQDSSRFFVIEIPTSFSLSRHFFCFIFRDFFRPKIYLQKYEP